MSCTACGTVNPAGRKFCGECGARLARACASCGAPLDAGQKFCGECGTAQAAAGAVVPAQGPVVPAQGPGAHGPAAPGSGAAASNANAPTTAERRLVSVLFADLVGFTPYSEGRDAEEVRETLTRYFDLARDAIGRHGGTIEKFIGDAVMAVWGTPTAREDDAERAVRAALELLDAVKGLGNGIGARAGVLTGEAAVTLGATDQGMVAGDLVNTAARIQSAAAPGTVLVGEATYRAASAAIAFEEAGDQVLKGKELPVATWRALRVVAERGGRGRAEVLEAPFVGRDEELRLLKELFHATTRERRARLVSVTGPAGMGKSRLAWEFEKYLDGVVDAVWWNHGRSPAYGGGVTFWALGEMVRARCGLAETADEPETRAKVRAMLERFVPDVDERAWVEPAILALLGVGSPAVAADELFARWRVLFERLSATGTVVLVFEDLHWADAGTLDFIDHLLDWSKALPLLVVTLARPELLDARPDWGAGRRSFVALPLDPLPEPAMRALLAGLVPALPEDALRRIVARAEGIPLYAVETVRMLVAEKRLVQQGRVYVPVGDISTLAVPETLTALIAARLDTLDAADRSLVLDAAVLGQRFTLAGLSAVSGVDPDILEPRLKGLVRRELVGLEADPRSPERGQYGFVQALIREVAYNTLARRDRKDRHLAAARFFEALGSDELAGALAGHYLSAHANAAEGPEADALAAQARVALRGAADRATALGSYEQAAHLLRQALTVVVQPADRADLLERLGLACGPAARYAEATTAFREALQLLGAVGDRAALVRVTREAGEVLLNAKQLEEGRDLLEAGALGAADLGADPSVVAMKGQLARAYFLLDDTRRAIALADEVLEAAEYAMLAPVLADTLVTKGTVLANIGRSLEGVALIELGGRIAEANGLVSTQLRALNNRAVSTVDMDPEQSYRVTLEGVSLARRVGSAAWVNNFIGNLIFLAFRLGDWDIVEREATARLEEALEAGDRMLIVNNLLCERAMRGQPVDDLLSDLEAVQAGVPEFAARATYLDSLAFVRLGEGDYEGAAAAWREAASLVPSSAAPALVTAARASLWAGRPEAAAADLAAYEALHLRLPAQDASGASLDAGLAALDGRRDEALRGFLAARQTLLGMSLVFDAALVAIDAGMTLGAGVPEIAIALRDARAFLDRVGGRPLTDVIDRILAAAGDGAASADVRGAAEALGPVLADPGPA